MKNDYPHYSRCANQPEDFPCICQELTDEYDLLNAEAEEASSTGN